MYVCVRTEPSMSLQRTNVHNIALDSPDIIHPNLRQSTDTRSTTITSQQITELELSEHNDNLTQFTDLECKNQEDIPQNHTINCQSSAQQWYPGMPMHEIPGSNNNGPNLHHRQSTASTIFKQQILHHISVREQHINRVPIELEPIRCISNKYLNRYQNETLLLDIVNSNLCTNHNQSSMYKQDNNPSYKYGSNVPPYDDHQQHHEIKVEVISIDDDKNINLNINGGSSTTTSSTSDDEPELRVIDINMDQEGNFRTVENPPGSPLDDDMDDVDDEDDDNKDEGNQMNDQQITEMIDKAYPSSDSSSDGDKEEHTTLDYEPPPDIQQVKPIHLKLPHLLENEENDDNVLKMNQFENVNENVNENENDDNKIIEIIKQFNNVNQKKNINGQRRHNSNNTNSAYDHDINGPHFIDNESDILEIDSVKLEGGNVSIDFTDKNIDNDSVYTSISSVSFNPSHGSNFLMRNDSNYHSKIKLFGFKYDNV